ncbi:MAG TPA: ribosomal protein S18-alanine N-acetyltransferase [Dermatophilaceae bacterium]|nr:ribosomal protein S18-alanine N-acetyltransferase [Dermatophilaceae bacterium]
MSAAPGLRELRWTDIPALSALELELFPDDAWAEASWWAELAARPRRHYLAHVGAPAADGAVTAYGGIDVTGEVADLMTLAVAPAARGTGLGRRLLAALEAEAVARGATVMMLEVRADNAPARALYAAAGYEQVRVRRRYYSPGDVDAHVLRRTLRGGDGRP